jgi:hypothetical protein
MGELVAVIAHHHPLNEVAISWNTLHGLAYFHHLLY